MPPISSPPPARPGPPWTRVRQRRAMPRQLRPRNRDSNEHEPAVIRRRAEHDGARRLVVVREQRADEAAAGRGARARSLRRIPVRRSPCSRGQKPRRRARGGRAQRLRRSAGGAAGGTRRAPASAPATSKSSGSPATSSPLRAGARRRRGSAPPRAARGSRAAPSFHAFDAPDNADDRAREPHAQLPRSLARPRRAPAPSRAGSPCISARPSP